MVSRRQFIQRMMGMGALIATSKLPALAEDNPSVFPQRGQYERMSISYAIVNLGLEHLTFEDQFSPTCREYLVAGNFLFHGREVLFV